jgi:hypothetical protein
MMSLAVSRVLLLSLTIALLFTATAEARAHSHCSAKQARQSKQQQTSKISYKGKVYCLATKEGKIRLVVGGRSRTLDQIPKKLAPSLVGAGALSAFLPLSLQPYADRGIFLYTSARRSSAGNGAGQCGAGIEVYLHVVDLANNARSLGKSLITSCLEAIELVDQDLSKNYLGAISIQSGSLNLHFLTYGNLQGSPMARLSGDFRSLQFSTSHLDGEE